MRLKRFRIWNYKSIRDSGDCYLASDLTILAGKNESGKSAILEALRDFDPRVEDISDAAMPLDGSASPRIEAEFVLDEDEIQALTNTADVRLGPRIRRRLSEENLVLNRDKEKGFFLSEALIQSLDESEAANDQRRMNRIKVMIASFHQVDALAGIEPPDVDESDEYNLGSVEEFVKAIRDALPAISDDEVRSGATEQIEQIVELTKEIEPEWPSDRLLNAVLDAIPRFVFFSDFDNILPWEISFDEADKHQAVKDFAKVADLPLDEVIKTTDSQRRRNLLSKHSARITGELAAFYEQDSLELVAETDGGQLLFGVREQGNTLLYKAEQRSRGFQWFLSFFLRLAAEAADQMVILIDEPGLHLHAKAQEDVLHLLEHRIAKKCQVLFSTHSNYLLDPNRLDRIRLVIKDSSGSRIENKVHRSADVATLTPILTAIGDSVARSSPIAAQRNVLLEGMSDYYYLQAMRRYLNQPIPEDVRLIPCVGASQVPTMASLLIGWGLDFVAVFDHDSAGKGASKKLREKLHLESDRNLLVSDEPDTSLEDLFAAEDFHKYVLGNDEAPEIGQRNSRYLRDKRLDKVLVAKNFFDRVQSDKEDVKLSKETTKAFGALLERIRVGLEAKVERAEAISRG